jgi:hypothetical protein
LFNGCCGFAAGLRHGTVGTVGLRAEVGAVRLIPNGGCMPLLIILFALLVPRVTILVLWLFSNWFEGLFTNLLWPLLGFILLPTATLWYSAVHNWFGGEWNLFTSFWLFVSVIIDLSPMGRRRAPVESA